jgi:hypothetical protein
MSTKTNKTNKTNEINDYETTNISEKYISTFTPLEKKAYQIAKTQLESSFDIEKSIGFCDWVKEKEI